MRIWLVQTGEEMPFDGAGTRLLRTGLLARELVRRGHEVTFWNATFNHQKKEQRSAASYTVDQVEGYRAILLAGRSYRRNVSISRILSQRENAAEFARLAAEQPRPDVIHCGLPTIELAAAVADFAHPRGIPFSIDARDMWPEVMEEHLAPMLRFAARPVIGHWRAQRNNAMARAAAVTGVSDAFVAWAAKSAGRERGPLDACFHQAANVKTYSADELAMADQRWLSDLGPVDPYCRTILLAGNLSSRVDIRTAIDAAVSAGENFPGQTKLVVCGKGDLEAEIAERARTSAGLHFAGWCSGAELKQLAARCCAGLLPYSNLPDLVAAIPNKAGEYLSYGLPVVSCLRGQLEAHLGPKDVLIAYQEGDADSAERAFVALDPVVGAAARERSLSAFRALFDPAEIYPAFAKYLERLASAPVEGEAA